MESGISVFLWNYRGYGRSQGKANIERIKKDGEVIVNYLRTQKLVTKLGVHGESLGGCIAIYLAKECVLDFLIADRTFSSLSAVAFFNFGRLAYWIYKLARGDDFDSVSDYLAVNCFKILMSDPNDQMITDLSSLKSGVALKLLFPDSNLVVLEYLKPSSKHLLSHILTPPAISSCTESLIRLHQFLDCINGENNSFESSAYFKTLNRDTYEKIRIDTENYYEENLANCLERFFATISKINAAGKSLVEIINEKYQYLSLLVWLMTLDIWGSSLKASEERTSAHMKCINIIRTCLLEIENIQNEYEKSENIIVQQVFKDVNTIFNVLVEVLGFMEERCGISSDLDETIDKSHVDYHKAGILIPLNCGHSGLLNPSEKFIFSKHLLEYLELDCKVHPIDEQN